MITCKFKYQIKSTFTINTSVCVPPDTADRTYDHISLELVLLTVNNILCIAGLHQAG